VLKTCSVHETTIIPYAKSWNLAFADQIQTRLPPELRNMIWEWVWDDVAFDDHFDDLLLKNEETARCKHSPCNCNTTFDPNIPHYLQLAFVGATTAREIVETMYKNSPLYWTARTNTIKDVLFHDPFHVGFNPLSTIRKLYVDCKIDNYRTPRKCFRRNRTCEHKPAERAYIKRSELKASFDHLLAVPKKAGFDLSVTFYQRNVRLAVLEEALETFRDVYLAFQDAGATLDVDWQYSLCNASPRKVNVHDFYDKDVSRDAWRAEMRGAWVDVRCSLVDSIANNEALTETGEWTDVRLTTTSKMGR